MNRQFVVSAFALLERGEFEAFFDRYVDDDVRFEITGSGLLAGVYERKYDFIKYALKRIEAVLQPGWIMKVRQVYVDGHMAIVEMISQAMTLKGDAYNNVFCWVVEFRQDKIITARAYYDDVLIDHLLIHNE